MAFVHSKKTVIKVNSKDISAYCSNSQLERTANSHDVTGYGADSKSYFGGLLDATFSADGTYDNTATTGERAALAGLVGTVVPLIRQPEGTGSGLPQESVDILVTKYTESAAVADMIKWSLEAQCTGDVDATPQSA